MTSIALATEDELSEAVGLKILMHILGSAYVRPLLLRRRGFGYLRSKMKCWKEMAQHQVVVIITDLDRLASPVALINDWLGEDRNFPDNLILRVAVREVESWLMADHDVMKLLLGSKGKLPLSPDDLADPKQHFLHLAKQAPRRIKEDLVAFDGAVASQGIGYNRVLCQIVLEHWCPKRASENSKSLKRALQAITTKVL